MEGATYFVTWRLHRSQRSLAPSERDLVAQTLGYFDQVRYRLLAWVVMDDHVHVIVTPITPWELSKITHSWKSVSANRLQRLFGRRFAVWQHESHDRLIRRRGELAQKVQYVRDNPVRRWPGTSEYRWVWWDHSALGG